MSAGRKAQVESSDMVPLELILLYLLWLFGWSYWSCPWTMIGVILTSVLLAITVTGIIHRWHKRRERARLLKEPFEVHFLIPKETEFKVDYHSQDSEYHYPDELSLPSNSETIVVVWMKPRLNVVLSELQFGCIGNNESKPEPLYYFNWWVKEGPRKEIRPETNENQYRDTTNIYHMMYHGRAIPEGEVHLPGLRIRTKERGSYRFWIGIIMPEGRADTGKLLLRVV